ncbi:unnamed protein product [Amoebophrya sp. A25]|nr:unnamed protein product [Amoebophrya sp. A25]|eukprot:GSA25T00024258001.1
MEKKFAKELWTLLMELTLPNSESLLLDLFKFMQSLASGDPLPGSFFAMLDRLKRDWRAALFATERVLLSQNAEQIKNAMERKVDNVSSLKPAAILTTYKAQNLEAHKSQALLAYLTDVHDCDLHIVERWTTALAQNHSDKQNVSWSGIALKLQTQLDQSAQQREAMQKRKEALEDASKTQREELGTQLGGLSDGKKEVQVRVDALEKEKVELEAKLQTINTELSELKAQVGRVENSEHALKRETENALVFYEENLVVLKKQEALAMREKTMLEQMKLTCERGGEIQISYLRSAIEGQKKLAEEAYAALKAEGLRHFDLEAVRLRTAMTLVEQSCVVFQECKFAVGQTGGGLSSSGLEQGTSTNSSPGTTGHEQRELERLKQQKLRDSLMEVKRAVLLRDRCKAEVDAFLTKYKSRLLQEEKTKVAQLLEEWQKHQAKHEKLLTEDEALRSFLTTNKATTGTTPCPSGGEHQYLQYQHPARHQTSNNVDARTSSSGETALNQMASKSEAVMGNLTSAFSATGSFLGKLRDENFPPLPPEGGGKAVPEKNTSSTTSKGVLAGGLFDQFSSDINTLFFSSPAPSPSGAEKVGSVNTATTSGAAGASAAGGTKLFDTSGTATGRTKTTIPATSEPIPVRENAPAPSSSGPVEFHSMATPENSPAAATSQEQTFAPFAAAADAAGKTTAAASNVEVPTVTPTPTTGESSTTTVVAPPVATATVVTTTAAGAVSFKTATQAPPPAGASAPTVPGAAPTAAPVAKKADDDDDIFAMFEADLGLDSKPFAPPARINADAE